MLDRPLNLTLVDATGEPVSAEVELKCRDWTEGGFRKTEVRLLVHWPGGEAPGTDWNYFAALCRAREKLATFGLIPRCYGACRNLVLSGMCLDMSLGRNGYLVRLGQPVRLSDLVSIFGAGRDMDLASVAELARFKQEWLRSLGAPV